MIGDHASAEFRSALSPIHVLVLLCTHLSDTTLYTLHTRTSRVLYLTESLGVPITTPNSQNTMREVDKRTLPIPKSQYRQPAQHMSRAII